MNTFKKAYHKFIVRIISNKALFFAIAAIIWLLLLQIVDLNWYKLSGFWQGILTEAHGMFFDLLIFGVVLTTYETITEKQREIKRLLEEIEDFIDWEDREATFRISGCIRRLYKLGVRKFNLRRSNLSFTNLSWMNIEKSNFAGSNLMGTTFQEMNISNSNFSLANLENCFFLKSTINSIIVKDANLKNVRIAVVDTFDINEQSIREFNHSKYDIIKLSNTVDYGDEKLNQYLILEK
jgi:hypothetical protein